MKLILRVLLLTSLFVGSSAIAETPPRPNIVFVMADDLAWADVGFNGNEFYETPNIDALATNGMIFDRGYSGGPNCLPTRACLISGMYTPRTQIWTPGGRSKGAHSYMKFDVPAVGNKNQTIPSKVSLEPSVSSIAEVLNSAGYHTARFGKWHVGPDTQGFDISDPSGKGGRIGSKYYGNIDVAEWLTDAGINFIKNRGDQPFFLYLSHWDVHTPIKARKAVKDHFDDKLKNGQWSRKWNTTYAAMISAVDTSVARLRKTLKDEGIADNTLFVFTSDNGGHAGATTNQPLKGAKGALNEGGIRVPMAMEWPKRIQAGSRTSTPITSVDFMPTFADLAGADLPEKQPVDGVSFRRLFSGETLAERNIFWHYPLYLQGSGEGRVVPVFKTENLYWRGVPSSALISGPWKMIHYFESDSVVLYNLDDDPSESTDLSLSHPEKSKQMKTALHAWQQDTAAVIPTKLNEVFNPLSKGKSRKK